MSQTSEKPPTTANSNLDPLEPQPNAQQESIFILLFPRLVSLTDLKVQSAFIQCSHSLRFVYTKASHCGNYWESISLYMIIKGFFPNVLSDE